MNPLTGASPGGGDPGFLSWVHFGDLHLTTECEQNYRDFRSLIDEANTHLSGDSGVRFAFLPGDNADKGTEDQYRLLRGALESLCLPWHALPGDHDLQSGTLDSFRRWLEPESPKRIDFGGYCCLFLNSVDTKGKEGFGLGELQLTWLEKHLREAGAARRSIVIFMHTYPSELGAAATRVRALLSQSLGVRLVEMGHTHYNEVANDGRIVYAATRSTGQIEEGPVGFSLSCLDHGVVSWKFKELHSPWPFVMITSPADRAFLTEGIPAVRGVSEVRARAWGQQDNSRAICSVDDGPFERMFQRAGSSFWRYLWDSASAPDGPHRLTVRVQDSAGEGEDTIVTISSQSGRFERPQRLPGDAENAIGSDPGKGILGTQLGPNKNGHGW